MLMREMNYWVTLQMLDSPLCHVYALTLKSTFFCYPPSPPSIHCPFVLLSLSRHEGGEKSQSLCPGSAEGSRHSFVTLTSAVARMYRHEALLVQTRLYITYVPNSIPSLFVFPSPWVFPFSFVFPSFLTYVASCQKTEGGALGVGGWKKGRAP